jgi:hypothetical protein
MAGCFVSLGLPPNHDRERAGTLLFHARIRPIEAVTPPFTPCAKPWRSWRSWRRCPVPWACCSGMDKYQFPDRPRSLSGEYLQQSLNALHSAGDPHALWDAEFRKAELHPEGEAVGFLLAQRRRIEFARNAVLFAALAAESYINEFLAARLDGRDFDAVDRMSTVNKYVLGTKLAMGEALFDREKPPVPALVDLFKTRNRLVHPKPGFGPPSIIGRADEYDELFAPSSVAWFVVMVAAAGCVLVTRAFGPKTMDIPASVIWPAHEVVLDYGRRAMTLPDRGDEPEPSLFAQAMERFIDREGREPDGKTGDQPRA